MCNQEVSSYSISYAILGVGMKIGYENRTCCVAGQVGIWKILVFGSKNQTQISEKLIFGPVKTGPKSIQFIIQAVFPINYS